MSKNENHITFGPVPSRRLGRSLGINNIPPKICTYACIYCQIGRTLKMTISRGNFYSPDVLKTAVEKRLKELEKSDEKVDYITFVPDGEPTLDLNLKEHIKNVREFGIKTAVITNSSLMWDPAVREALHEADWVSVKVDAIDEKIWHKVDRPHGRLILNDILNGIKEFSRNYSGYLVTETMLVDGVNDDIEELNSIADFIGTISIEAAYLSVPTRPPSEVWVKPPSEYNLYLAYHIFTERSIKTELLIGYEGNEFSFTGNVEEDLLSITSVHPMREDAVREYLKKANAEWESIEKLISENKLIEVKYGNNKFYMRKLG